MNPLLLNDNRALKPVTLDPVIESKGLVKKFGRNIALDGLDILVPRGSVYALLGRNGAGKSTFMQLVMGMLDATSGSLSVLGLDPVRDSVALKKRIGYIPDRLPMYEWMTVTEALRFCASFHDNWSHDDEAALVKRFDLVLNQKVGALSRGNRALLALVMAMSHQPDIVLLDECTSGMDAIARHEFERSVIDALQDSNRTVLYSGHQIDDLERICDWVGIIHNGKLQVQMPLDTLKVKFRMLRLSGIEDETFALPGCSVLSQRKMGRDRLVTVQLVRDDGLLPQMPSGLKIVEEVPMSLEELFVAIVSGEESQ